MHKSSGIKPDVVAASLYSYHNITGLMPGSSVLILLISHDIHEQFRQLKWKHQPCTVSAGN
ncbi:MAG: hypothetical protein ACK2TV_01280, partial [Anaerolineales bacterium]